MNSMVFQWMYVKANFNIFPNFITMMSDIARPIPSLAWVYTKTSCVFDVYMRAHTHDFHSFKVIKR